MKYRVVVAPRVLAELRTSARYIANQNPVAARQWFDAICLAIEGLAHYPERCPVAYTPAQAGREIRQLLFGKRLGIRRIFYSIENDKVQVLVVRYAAQQDPFISDLIDE